MQGKYRCRLSVLGIAGMILLAGLSSASAQPDGGRRARLLAVVPNPVGLVMDFWANTYTVDRCTGMVFCLPWGSEPVHYATIEGEPTSLAVDRKRTLYIGTVSGHVLAVHRDGTVTEACQCAGPVAGLTVDRDGGLFIATGNGAIFKMDRMETAASN